jgi:hypothetical protein
MLSKSDPKTYPSNREAGPMEPRPPPIMGALPPLAPAHNWDGVKVLEELLMRNESILDAIMECHQEGRLADAVA